MMTPDPTINSFSGADIQIIVDAFEQANWQKPAAIFESYLQEQLKGVRLVWVAYAILNSPVT